MTTDEHLFRYLWTSHGHRYSQPIGDQIEEFIKRVRGEEAWCVIWCSVLIIVPGIWPVTFVFESYIPREG